MRRPRTRTTYRRSEATRRRELAAFTLLAIFLPLLLPTPAHPRRRRAPQRRRDPWERPSRRAWTPPGLAFVFTSKILSGTTTDATSFNTASWTPADGNLYLLSVANDESAGTAATTPTATGNGLTWALSDATNGTTGYGGSPAPQRVSILRALVLSGSSAGATAIDFNGHTQHSIEWAITEVTGTDTSGTNGSGAIAQAKKATGSSSTPTLSLTATATGNSVFAIFGNTTNTSMAAGSGYTRLNDAGQTSNNIRLMTMYQVADGLTTVNSTTSVTSWGEVALEIKAAAAAAGTINRTRRARSIRFVKR